MPTGNCGAKAVNVTSTHLALSAERRPVGQASQPTHGSLDQWLVHKLLQILGSPPIRLRIWSDEDACTANTAPVATLRISDRAALLRLIADPAMQFGELYMNDRIRLVDGSLVAALEMIFLRQSQAVRGDCAAATIARLLRRTRRNSLAGSRRNIHEHYDLGNDFYRLWLDPTLSYTCAYFPTVQTCLADAQIAKLDYVCRKLRLNADDEVVEAGCGWGGLALHAAGRFGARVRAFNISHEQIVYARKQAQRLGLTNRIEFIEDDYRNVKGACDAFVSVGMLEHVGPDNYRELGRLISRTLRPNGCGLIHSIGRVAPEPVNAWIERRIFPGAYIPSLQEMMQIFEPAGMSVLDVENLRLHYARTLECWLATFERQQSAIAKMFDERFVRMWRLYLSGSQAAFQAGDMQLFQVLFAPAASRRTAWTRQHLYTNKAEAPA
jgi:cyclopropane-fatty-acyl-phospholipid synthase